MQTKPTKHRNGHGFDIQVRWHGLECYYTAISPQFFCLTGYGELQWDALDDLIRKIRAELEKD
jgi:hypothetical protein